MVTSDSVNVIRNLYTLGDSSGKGASTDAKLDLQYCSKHGTDGSPIQHNHAYGCNTCNLLHGQGICYVCAKACHEGHEIVALGPMTVSCGCSTRGIGLCNCRDGLKSEEIESHVLICSSWCCDRCTVINPTSSTICTVCNNARSFSYTDPFTSKSKNDTPAVQGEGQNTSGLGDLAMAAAMTSSNVEEKIPSQTIPSQWTCGACTMSNPSSLSRCETCNTERPNTSMDINTSSTAFDSKRSEEWNCLACTMLNNPSDTSCQVCGTAREMPSEESTSSKSTAIIEHPTVNNSNENPIPVNAPTHVETKQSDSQIEEKLKTLRDLWSFKFGTIMNSNKRIQDIGRLLCGNKEQTCFWDTTEGIMSFELGEKFVGIEVAGEYQNDEGCVRGIATLDDDNTWYIRGSYIHGNQICPNAFEIKFDSPCKKFTGCWYRGDASGEWKCNLVPDAKNFRGLSSGRPFYSGLVNMKDNLTNVCYQNSFIQALFLTDAFREAILSVSITKETKSLMSSQMDSAASLDLFQTIQQLFAQLTISQRKYLYTHQLQSCLPSLFQQGRQQDTSDFAHFLMDQLNIGFQSTSQQPNALRTVFGGSQATVLVCTTCKKISTRTEYFWELMLNMVDLRYTAITDVVVVSGVTLDIPIPPGYVRLNMNLNQDRDLAPYLFLCVERDAQKSPITDFLIRTIRQGETPPILSGFTLVNMNLNTGGSIGSGEQVYLYFKKDPTGSPITDLSVTYGDEVVPDGFRQIRIDLNQGQGKKTFLCYRSDMPLRDIHIVTEGRPGLKTIDTNLNLSGDPTSGNAKPQYLAHTDGGNLPCITAMRLVKLKDKENAESEGWSSAGPPLANGYNVMMQRGEGNPIYAIDVFRSPRQVPKFKDYEVLSLYPSENSSNTTPMNLIGDWNAEDSTDRPRRAVRFTSVGSSNPLTYVEGTYDSREGGKLHGILTDTQDGKWNFVGVWQDKTVQFGQLMQIHAVTMNSGNGDQMQLSGSVGDGKGEKIVFKAVKNTSMVSRKNPIVDICVIQGHEQVPFGFSYAEYLISKTPCNLLNKTTSSTELFVCIKRGEASAEIDYVSDIAVIYGEIDSVPEGYIPLYHTPSGISANFNEGTTGVPMFLCFKRLSSKEKPLMDIGFLWSGGTNSENLPTGYTKIQHSPLGMEANINQGTGASPLFICYKREDPPTQYISHSINGTYSSTWGNLTLFACRQVIGHQFEGKYGSVMHGELQGNIQGFLYYDDDQNDAKEEKTKLTSNVSMMGAWTTRSRRFPYPFEMTVTTTYDSIKGWWSCGTEGGTWNLWKDTYVDLAYKKDYGTQWKNGKLLSSDRVAHHDVVSMLDRFVAPRTLGGENSLECSDCQRRTPCITQTVIAHPPEHLILTFKRMWYDWKLQKTMKCLHTVQYPPYFHLPSVPTEFTEHIYETNQETLKCSNRCYGLYAILVHNGMSANSGHYYTYARDSLDGQDELYMEDSPRAPWMKFNDTEITMTTWKNMVDSIGNSVSDSVYLLFYKKLSPQIEQMLKQRDQMMEEVELKRKEISSMNTNIPTSLTDEDGDEEMLLAQAMALSMSSSIAVSDNDSILSTNSENNSTDTSKPSLIQIDENDTVVKQLLSKAIQENEDYYAHILPKRNGNLFVKELHTLCMMKNNLNTSLIESYLKNQAK